MKNQLNPQRIKYLLQADWIENKTKFLYLMGAYMAAFLIFIVAVINSDTAIFRSEQLQGFYILGGLGTFIYYCHYAGNKIHFPKGVYMTLPASTLEKFLSILTTGIIIALIYILLIHITTFTVILIAQENVSIEWEKINALLQFLLPIASFVLSLFFLSYMTFSKHAFLIAVCGSAMMMIAGILLARFFINGMSQNPETTTEQSPLISMFKFIWLYYGRILIIAVTIILYVAYLKLKEKELR